MRAYGVIQFEEGYWLVDAHAERDTPKTLREHAARFAPHLKVLNVWLIPDTVIDAITLGTGLVRDANLAHGPAIDNGCE